MKRDDINKTTESNETNETVHTPLATTLKPVETEVKSKIAKLGNRVKYQDKEYSVINVRKNGDLVLAQEGLENEVVKTSDVEVIG